MMTRTCYALIGRRRTCWLTSRLVVQHPFTCPSVIVGPQKRYANGRLFFLPIRRTRAIVNAMTSDHLRAAGRTSVPKCCLRDVLCYNNIRVTKRSGRGAKDGNKRFYTHDGYTVPKDRAPARAPIWGGKGGTCPPLWKLFTMIIKYLLKFNLIYENL
jgi:hypothetical protein